MYLVTNSRKIWVYFATTKEDNEENSKLSNNHKR